jgi:hypothetical protein
LKLIFLYGPPAVGKLAIATRLSKATGLFLFHNHLATDLARSVMYPLGWKEYSDLASEIRLTVARVLLARKARGLIMTYAYGLESYQGRDDLAFIKALRREVAAAGRMIYFIKLIASPSVLGSRVSRASRRRFDKLTDAVVLSRLLTSKDLTSSLPDLDSLVIDTGHTSATAAARLIARYAAIRSLRTRPQPRRPLSGRESFRYLLQ